MYFYDCPAFRYEQNFVSQSLILIKVSDVVLLLSFPKPHFIFNEVVYLKLLVDVYCKSNFTSPELTFVKIEISNDFCEMDHKVSHLNLLP